MKFTLPAPTPFVTTTSILVTLIAGISGCSQHTGIAVTSKSETPPVAAKPLGPIAQLPPPPLEPNTPQDPAQPVLTYFISTAVSQLNSNAATIGCTGADVTLKNVLATTTDGTPVLIDQGIVPEFHISTSNGTSQHTFHSSFQCGILVSPGPYSRGIYELANYWIDSHPVQLRLQCAAGEVAQIDNSQLFNCLQTSVTPVYLTGQATINGYTFVCDRADLSSASMKVGITCTGSM